jgi:hypothetical protein
MITEQDIEVVAVTLSMADPDERGLPEGVDMAEFYRMLARAALSAIVPILVERCAEKAESFDDLAPDNPYSEAARVIAREIRSLASCGGGEPYDPNLIDLPSASTEP